MKIIGLSFSKFNAEKFSDPVADLKINTKIDVSTISKMDVDSFKFKEEVLEVKFSFGLDYAPNYAVLSIEGSILLGVDSKLAIEVLDKWKNREMPAEFKISLFNIILRRSSLKALQFEENLGLPPHFQFPLLKESKN